ncbi:hypothetical protein [Oceanitalea stevensii]|uniref:Photosynthesis system II assembly factor Ycf48/Hcf136-like domain-containing protein n=1 Tax=Oceanitalea stevensii TaxID=2763072 RepID=A0ABR8Z4X8_9MICO|nr:hypothetical protein [Oceanitalea stevensii]MBD8063400.1 hypothetical protein [Oceanitalea stevensii]
MLSRSSRPWSALGLGALVVLNIVLIGLLLVRPAPGVDGEAPDAAPPATPTGVAEGEPPAKREPAELPTTRARPDHPEPAERIIVGTDATTAWRAEVGTCEDAATFERTTDGGETWEEVPLDLAPVSRVRVLGPQTLFVIGGAADCEPTYLSSSTAGSNWLSNDQYLDGSWYLVPSDSTTIATPAGTVGVPCKAVDLAALDASDAAILCQDGDLALTSDGGVSWEEAEAPIAAFAIGVRQDGFALAGTHERCDEDVAVVLTAADGAALDEPSCVAADAGSLAVSGGPDALWLWAGDDTFVSTDGGRSW